MIKPVISLITAATLCLWASPVCTSAEADVYTVNFLDLDGKPCYTITVPAGRQIDKQVISQIDTSKLRKQVNARSQEWFSEWWGIPECVTENVDIKPLSVTGTITLESIPVKRKYYSLDSPIYRDGLHVNITLVTQTGIDEKGNYITKDEIVDVSSTCSMKPETAGDAFKSGDKATVDIFPINSDHPIGSYDITYIDGIADVNGDKIISGSDATKVLNEYTKLSADSSYKVDEAVMAYGDMDFNGVLNGSDATILLRYYTLLSSYDDYNLDKFYAEMNIKNTLN